MTENSEPTDLFGLPRLEQPERRGRRELVFAPEAYERVETLAAGGMTQEEIAAALRISVPTLTKFFGKELGEAHARRKAEALQLLAGSARKGNVGAQKEWLRRLETHSAAAPYRRRERNSGDAAVAAVAQPTPIGKKALARAAAKSAIAAGDKFAPRGLRLAATDGEAVD